MSRHRSMVLGQSDFTVRAPAPIHRARLHARLAAVCAERVPTKPSPELPWLHPYLPCGDGTCPGEVAAVNAVTTLNTEFDLGATQDGDGRSSVGCHVPSAVVNQHSPTVLSTS